MNKRQIELARHALGLPNPRRESYRNHFVAGPGHDDFADWKTMVEQGNAIQRNGNVLTGGDFCFHLTDSGARAALKPGERLSEEDF